MNFRSAHSVIVKMDPPIICGTCKKVMANAITISCCSTVMCRGCAVRSLVRTKKCANTNCLKISSLDQVKLTPNLEIREFCEKAKESGKKITDLDNALESKTSEAVKFIPYSDKEFVNKDSIVTDSAESVEKNEIVVNNDEIVKQCKRTEESEAIIEVDESKRIHFRQLFCHPSYPTPAPSDLYSLEKFVLHHLALHDWTLDELCLAMKDRLLQANPEDLKREVKQVLDNCCSLDLDSGKYRLRKEYWDKISEDWPYYSSKEQLLFRERITNYESKTIADHYHIIELLHLLISEQKPLDHELIFFNNLE